MRLARSARNEFQAATSKYQNCSRDSNCIKCCRKFITTILFSLFRFLATEFTKLQSVTVFFFELKLQTVETNKSFPINSVKANVSSYECT